MIEARTLGRLLDAPTHRRFSVTTVAAPVGDPARLISLDHREPSFLTSRDGQTTVGIGETWSVESEGTDRFAQLERARLRLRSDLSCDGAFQPRLLGGFAFAEERISTDFPPCVFTLPRWTYWSDGTIALLSFAADRSKPIDAARRAHERECIIKALCAGRSSEEEVLVASRECAGPNYRELVADARAAIRRGALSKVVLARRVSMHLARPVVPEALLARLRKNHPRATTFAVRRRGRMFLGATPELLVSKHGRHVVTEALAGTAGRDIAAEAFELLGKERHEHEIVARHIDSRLRPMCATLFRSPAPRADVMGQLMHLRTRFEGELAGDPTACDLIAALHPTPAVAGWPTEAACRWIAEHEGFDRGWYAGGVGWIDTAGDGEVSVALRAGLFDGSRAELYAGAGIVAGSDPDAEYAETELKLRTLLDVLDGAS